MNPKFGISINFCWGKILNYVSLWCLLVPLRVSLSQRVSILFYFWSFFHDTATLTTFWISSFDAVKQLYIHVSFNNIFHAFFFFIYMESYLLDCIILFKNTLSIYLCSCIITCMLVYLCVCYIHDLEPFTTPCSHCHLA